MTNVQRQTTLVIYWITKEERQNQNAIMPFVHSSSHKIGAASNTICASVLERLFERSLTTKKMLCLYA